MEYRNRGWCHETECILFFRKQLDIEEKQAYLIQYNDNIWRSHGLKLPLPMMISFDSDDHQKVKVPSKSSNAFIVPHTIRVGISLSCGHDDTVNLTISIIEICQTTLIPTYHYKQTYTFKANNKVTILTNEINTTKNKNKTK